MPEKTRSRVATAGIAGMLPRAGSCPRTGPYTRAMARSIHGPRRHPGAGSARASGGGSSRRSGAVVLAFVGARSSAPGPSARPRSRTTRSTRSSPSSPALLILVFGLVLRCAACPPTSAAPAVAVKGPLRRARSWPASPSAPASSWPPAIIIADRRGDRPGRGAPARRRRGHRHGALAARADGRSRWSCSRRSARSCSSAACCCGAWCGGCASGRPRLISAVLFASAHLDAYLLWPRAVALFLHRARPGVDLPATGILGVGRPPTPRSTPSPPSPWSSPPPHDRHRRLPHDRPVRRPRRRARSAAAVDGLARRPPRPAAQEFDVGAQRRALLRRRRRAPRPGGARAGGARAHDRDARAGRPAGAAARPLGAVRAPGALLRDRGLARAPGRPRAAWRRG